MEENYVRSLPDELVVIILHRLFGTPEIYSLIDVLNLDVETSFYKVCREVSTFFKRIPFKCKVGTKYIRWEGCYTDLSCGVIETNDVRENVFTRLTLTEDEIYALHESNACELRLVLLYDCMNDPVPRKFMYTIHFFKDLLEDRLDRLVFCVDMLKNLVDLCKTYIKKVLSECKPETKYRRPVDPDGYILWDMGPDDVLDEYTLWCTGFVKNGMWVQLSKRRQKLIESKGYKYLKLSTH